MAKLEKKTLIQIGAVLLIILAILLIPSDRRKIRKQFKRLADLAQKEQNESVFKGARKASAISELLTNPSEIVGNINFLSGTYSRREATQVIIAARTQLNAFRLSFQDMTIDFPQKNIATVSVVARLDASLSGETYAEMRKLECRMHKVGKHWLFNQCRSADSWRE